MKSRIALTALLTSSLAAPTQAQPVSKDQADIDQVLQASAQDWSRGNLAAFMKSYEDSPDTTFITKDGLLKGGDAIKSHYDRAYAAKRGAMGKLTLKIVDDRPLSPAYALVSRFRFITGTHEGVFGGNATVIVSLLMNHTLPGCRIRLRPRVLRHSRPSLRISRRCPVGPARR